RRRSRRSSQAEARALIIYIHGIGRQDPPELLHARLDRILFGGPNPATRLAYYADVLHRDRPPTALTRLKAAARWKDDPQLEAAEALLVDEELQAPAAPVDEETGARMLALRARLQRHLDATTSDRPHWLERQAFRVVASTLLPDVGAYFFGGYGEAMREPLRRLLREASGGLTLISHSLGTVISYHVLLEPEFAGLRVDHWLTLGSPLGVDEIRWLATTGLPRPAPVPSTVARWLNFADPLDPVALDGTLRDEYGPAQLIEEYRVAIQCRSHHAMRAYVSNETVRAAVLAAAGWPAA
ncbi:MAG TPA: hypothetical protein VET90_02510, partial [Candidatus Binatus sp.]|nr:hypothetical protein [Candidatus Binatus sp.]